jgi:hypothetical protein
VNIYGYLVEQDNMGVDKCKRQFGRKQGFQKGGKLYKWCPGPQDKKAAKSSASMGSYYCTTPNGSQGNDFISTYSYVVMVIAGQAVRTAYVQCDYMK